MLIFNNLKNNIRSNMTMVIGIVLNLAFVFCFLFLKTVIEYTETFRLAFHYGDLVGNMNIFTEVSILSGMFLSMFLAVPYIKERIRDYGLLMILGIRKKSMYILLGLEYLIVWGITLIAGLLCGLLFGTAVYAILKYAGFPGEEIHWGVITGRVCGMVLGLSIVYIFITFIYLLIRMSNKNLSEFASETSRPEKMRSMNKSVRLGLIGVCFIILSLTIKFTINYWPVFLRQSIDKDMLAFLLCIVGIYLLLTSGLAIVLKSMQKNEERYVRRMLSLNSMKFRIGSYRNIIFAVILLYYVVLFYVGNNVTIFSDGDSGDYSWRYPNDIAAYMTEEELKQWEAVCRKNDAEHGIQSVPYVDVLGPTGGKYIGIPESAYKKAVSRDIELQKDQILLCIQTNEQDGKNALEDWEGEDSIFLRTDNEEKEYAIAEKEVDILSIGSFMIEGLRVDIAVFEEEAYKELSDQIQTSKFMVMQNVPEEKEAIIRRELSNFRKEYPQIFCITRTEALAVEGAVDRLSSVIYIFCGILLTTAGLSMLGMKLFAEVSELEKKYLFLSYMGMKRKQKEKELSRECRQLIWIPALFGVFLSGIYKADVVLMYIQANPAYHLFEDGHMIEFVWKICRDWLCIVLGFCFVQILYGKYVISTMKKRIMCYCERNGR